ncbi:MAG: hypothetical protein LBD85_03025 [Oscillospiraceae bacterium]|jgi:hypothetical protein|nr:hypothetical protein [Oscillospiraceae bacterium]
MDTNKLLLDFKDFRISLEELRAAFGVTRFLNVKMDAPVIFTTTDAASAIKRYRSGEITVQTLVNWVNTLWFNEGIYDFADEQSESLASVMDLLEELDEDGVFYTDDEYDRMIAALESNTEFTRD